MISRGPLSAHRVAPLVLITLLLLLCFAVAASGQSAGHITGTITDENTGAPLAGIQVNVHQATGSWEIRGSAITDADGSYDVGDLDPGAYRIAFSDPAGNHVTEAYDNAPYLSVGADVTVSAGQTMAGINAALSGAGHIAGKVTALGTGNPLPGIQVDVCQKDGVYFCRWQPNSTVTTADGTYDLGGLLPGAYHIRFSDAAGFYYTAYYYGSPNGADAADVRVLMGQTTPHINAALLEPSRITGKVTDRISGKPLPGVVVSAFTLESWRFKEGETSTDTNGVYSIDLSPHSYQVEFNDPNGAYAPGDPVKVVVYKSRVTSGVDATLVPLGRITGTVTARAVRESLAGIQVTLHQWNGAQWAETKTVTTDNAGNYNSGGLTTGTYRVRFSDPSRRSQTTFYDGAANIESATTVSITLAHTTAGINAMLLERGRITGTVTAKSTGQPLAGIRVEFSPATSWRWGDAVVNVTSGADGAYDSGGLDADLYSLDFSDPNGKYAPKSSENVAVTATQTSRGIDIALLEWGHITGKVVAHDTGLPLPGIRVTVEHLAGYYGSRGWEWYWVEIATTTTDLNGRYDSGSLADDTYRVEFSDPSSVYVPVFTGDILVTIGSLVTGIDATLDRLEGITGHIAGTITARRTGVPLNNIVVSILSYDFGYWGSLKHTFSDANGDYDIGGLSPGTYRIEFFDKSGRFDLKYYDGATSLEAATNVNVVAGMVANDISAELVERGYITGKVIAQATGQPLAGIRVITEFSGGSWGDSITSTDANGRYRSGPLAAGTYQVWFTSDNGQYQTRSAQASVTNEQETPGIDAALIELGYITGRVTEETTGKPLPGIQVRCYSAHVVSYWRCGNITDADGFYKTPYLVSGAYWLQFVDPKGQYATEVYDNATSLEAGTDIIVSDNQTTTDINAALTEKERNRISGIVTDQETGAPLSGIKVDLWQQNGQNWSKLRSVTTATDGSYDSGKLVDGVYRVGFSDPSGHYQSEYYDNVGTLGSGTDINATGGGFISGIDAALDRLGSITGTVIDRTTGAPAAGIEVTVYKWNGQSASPWEIVKTSENGTYATNSLPNGIYRLRFMDYSWRYQGEYYDGAESLGSGMDVSVTAGKVTGNINAALAPWGQITGTVTDQRTGQALSGIWVTLWQWNNAWSQPYCTSSRTDGVYTLGGFGSGVYRVEFYDPENRYRFEFYNDAATIDAATDITFTVGQTISGINAALIKVVDDATLTPTPTATVTQEATPTATVVPVETLTPTATVTVEATPTSTPTSSSEQRRVYLPVILR